MSSLGDIVHTFPALSDAATSYPNLQIDWVIEEAFSDIPTWHPKVGRIIPIALRRWRKNFKKALQAHEFQSFLKDLRKDSYDYVIDAQGLVKSACVAKLARGLPCGFDQHSARERLASFFYQKSYQIDSSQHAVKFIRRLFANSLNYEFSDTPPNFGIQLFGTKIPIEDIKKPYWVFLHGTTHPNKEWPVNAWKKLSEMAVNQGCQVYLPWGNEKEYERACQISQQAGVQVLPRLTISQLASLLSSAQAVVGIDTGLLHLSCALNVPTLGIYKATSPHRLFISGPRQQYLQVIHQLGCKNTSQIGMGVQESCECFENIDPDKIFNKTLELSIG